MRKTYLLLAAFFFVSVSAFAQMSKKEMENLKTAQYAGKYSYDNGEGYGEGEVIVYPESDSTILFYIQLQAGEPSYNMGDLCGRVTLTDGKGVFEFKSDYAEEGCKWSMNFADNKLVIEIIDEQYECGFGYGVYADGNYNRKSNAIPEYFVDFTDTKQYFKKLKLEKWVGR